MPTVFTILSGQSVSSAQYIERVDRTLVVQVPSVANPGATSLQFAEVGSTGGSAGPFGPVWLPGMGSAFIWSGPGPGFSMPIEHPPTNWCRLSVANSVADVTSFTLHTLT